MIEYKFKKGSGLNVLVKTDAVAMDYAGKTTVMNVDGVVEENIVAGFDLRILDIVDEVFMTSLAEELGASLTKSNGGETPELLVEASNTVTFTVTDGAAAVAGASVVFNGETKATNASGVAVYTGVPDGVEDYTVTKALYDVIDTSVTVDGDEAVSVVLVLTE